MFLEFRGSFGDEHPRRGLDECQMRECLWEIAQVPSRLWIEFLGVKAKWRGNSQQPLHKIAGALHLAHDGERRDEPE